jgi:hypothetical protein
MNIIYYEVRAKSGKRYYRYPVDRKRYNLQDDYMGPWTLVFSSNRMWEWNSETDTVWMINNNKQHNELMFSRSSQAVDLREFALIQLMADDYRAQVLR